MNKALKKKYDRCLLIGVFAGVASVVFLGFATWVATIKIPEIEDKIQQETRIVEELRYRIETDLIQGLYGMAPETQQGIDVLNIQLEQIKTKSKSMLEDLLIKRVVQATIGEIQRWDSLFIYEEGAKSQVGISPLDPNVSPEKIRELEQTLTKVKENAFSRLGRMVEEIHQHNKLRAEYEKEQDTKQRWLAVLQIVGLIALVAATICEGVEKLSSRRREKQVAS